MRAKRRTLRGLSTAHTGTFGFVAVGVSTLTAKGTLLD
jgi:hypothetical protein